MLVDLAQRRDSGIHVAERVVESRVESGKTKLFKLDLASFSSERYPRGLSLYVQLQTKNAFDAELDAEQLFLSTDESKMSASVDARYTHKGVYELQTSPHELEATAYYIEYRNLLQKPIEFAMLFHLDEPQQKFLDSPFVVSGAQAEGDKLLYFFVNLTAARAENGGKPIAPAFVEAKLDSSVNELADVCAAEDDFVAQHACETTLMGVAVQEFWGTTYPVCVAHSELRRGIARDCWPAAVEVGRLAAASVQHNVFHAYAMCPENVCNDGCRHGILLAWVANHWNDDIVVDGQQKVIGTESRSICAELGDMKESCFSGIGAGIFVVAANAAAEIGRPPQGVFKQVSRDCGQVVAGLDDATKLAAQDWCIDGAFRHYVAMVTAQLNDTLYRASFPGLCDEKVIEDSQLTLKCFAAQGFSAAYRSRDQRGGADRLCGELRDETGARTLCLRAVQEYLNEDKLNMELAATCPIARPFSTVLYNLPPDYSAGAPQTEDAKSRALSWFNTSALWDGAHVRSDSDELWWMAVDANRASAKILVTLHSSDPRLRPTKPPGATPAPAVRVDDVKAERTNVAADKVRRDASADLISVFAGVSFAFVALKLLLLLWLRKKLRGY